MSAHTEFSDAIEHGDCDTVAALLHLHPDLVNHPDWTPPPLHCSVLWDQPKVGEMLLNNGADIEMRDPDRATTPLRYAIVFCRERMVSMLIARGANAGALEENGTTALQLAKDAAAGKFEDYDDMPSRDQYASIVKLLSDFGAN